MLPGFRWAVLARECHKESAVGPYPEERPVPVAEPFFDDFVQARKWCPFPTRTREDAGLLPRTAFVSPPPPLSRVQTEECRTRAGDPAVVAHRRTGPRAKHLAKLLELVL